MAGSHDWNADATPEYGIDRPEIDHGYADDAEYASMHRARRPRRTGRRIATVFGVFVLLVVGYFGFALEQVWSTGKAADDGPADAIVVMGAAQYDGRPSPQLAARLDHVAEIWPTVDVPLVIVTGGKLPGDRFTEAEASANYLIDRGIPADAILQEGTGSTTQASLASVADMLEAQGLSDVIIVTDPYHSLRSKLIAEEFGLNVQVSSTKTSVVTGMDSVGQHLQEAGGVGVGRIIGFGRLSQLVD